MRHSFRTATLGALATLLMAASPTTSLTISPAGSSLYASSAGLPQVRSVIATVGAGYTSAPVPNSDAGIPFVRNPAAGQAQLAPNLFTPPATGYRGEGYIRSSSADSEQQRKVKPGAGVALKVPLN